MRYASYMNPDLLHPRIDTDTCIRCRRKFLPGDRVAPAMIVLGVGRNPVRQSEVGSHLSHEYELTHIDCNDRALTRPILSPLP